MPITEGAVSTQALGEAMTSRQTSPCKRGNAAALVAMHLTKPANGIGVLKSSVVGEKREVITNLYGEGAFKGSKRLGHANVIPEINSRKEDKLLGFI